VTPVKITTRIAAGGLVGLASLFGSGIAHADSNQEKEACQLMDDPTGPQLGYAPAEYAFMLLRAKMSAEDARNVMSVAAQDFCPNHLIDLRPAGGNARSGAYISATAREAAIV
jgi:hypothetical protein